jgi:hypothetical protein
MGGSSRFLLSPEVYQRFLRKGSDPGGTDVIARLDRAIKYSRSAGDKSNGRGVLDTRWSLSSGSPKARPGGGYDG